MSKGSRNRSKAAAKIAEMRAAEARRKRRQRLLIGAGAVVVVAAVAVGITLAVSGGNSSAAHGGASTPKLKLASLSTLGTLQPAPSAGSTGPEQVPVPGAAAALISAIFAAAFDRFLLPLDTASILIYCLRT